MTEKRKLDTDDLVFIRLSLSLNRICGTLPRKARSA